VVAPYRTGYGVGRPGVDSGIEVDRQLGDMLGAAITVGAVLPADVQRRPSGNDHALREGGAVKQLWGVDRRWLSGRGSAPSFGHDHSSCRDG
jgi:hypothetical protein